MQAAKPLLTHLAPAAFLAGLLHLAWTTVAHWGEPGRDASLLWLAGDVWSAGGNPYTEEFAAAAGRFSGLAGAHWLSGPNWFPIAAFLSLFDPLAASRLWLLSNIALLLGASALNVLAFRRLAGQSVLSGETALAALFKSLAPLTLFMLHAGFIMTAAAAGDVLSSGAASAAVYFGASLLLFGAAAKRDLAGAGGIALLLLQPPVGLMFIAAMALCAYGRRAIVLGGLISFLMAVPALVIAPAADIAAALVSAAGQNQERLAAAATGLGDFLEALGAPVLGPAFYFLLALAAVSAAMLAGRKRARALKPADNLMIAAAAALAIAPLQTADFTLLGVIVLYAAAIRPPLGAAMLAASALAWRPGALPGFAAIDGGVYAFLGAAALLAALLAAAFLAPAPVPARRPPQPAPAHRGDNVVMWPALAKKRGAA